ncbi:MAG: DUF4345 family protein [Gammaproteobacteria bacterium]|nr:DUF4345 family protein [Gammaproteobacteria bacterium]
MQIAIKIVVGLMALLFTLMGLNLMFNPESAPVQFGIEAAGMHGLSTLRGDLGGMFLGAAVMLGWGVLRGRTTLFLAVAVLMGAIAFGRIIGFVADGANGQVIMPFIVELVMVVVLVFAHVRLGGANN